MPTAEVPSLAGGLNNFAQPHLLEPQFSTNLVDADVRNGALEPFRDKVLLTQVTNGFITNQNSTGERSIVKWQNEFYFSEDNTEKLSSTLGFMGIDPPASTVELTPVDRGSIFTGEYKYWVTFVTDEGFESSPHSPSNLDNYGNVQTTAVSKTLDLSDLAPFNRLHRYNIVKFGYHAGERVQFKGTAYQANRDFTGNRGSNAINIPILDAQFPDATTEEAKEIWSNIDDVFTTITSVGFDRIKVSNIPQPTQINVTKINVYRSTSNGFIPFLLETVDVGIVSLFDSVSDSALQLRTQLNLSLNNFPPIFKENQGVFRQVGGKFLTEVTGVFYLAVDDRIYFSRLGDPHSWNPLDFVAFDDTVTAIARDTNGVLVFTNNRSYRLVGQTIDTIFKEEIPGVQGCPNNRTISYVRNAPIWQSNDGICSFSSARELQGKFISILTENRFIFDRIANFAFAANDIYYLVFDDETICLDLRHELLMYKRSLTGTFGFYEQNNDRILLSQASDTFEVDAGEPLEYTYLSPELTMPGRSSINLSETKHFRRLWLNADADVTVRVLVNGLQTQETVSEGTKRRFLYFRPGSIGERLQLEFKSKGKITGYQVEYNLTRTA